MTAVEGERRHLAQELHDSVAQDLVALELLLRSTASGLAKQPARAEEAKAFETAVGRCNDAVREIRGICQGLYSPTLELFGLIPSLKQLAARGIDGGIQTHFLAGPELGDRRFGPDIEIAVFRIAQEALSNALRHSKGKTVSLTLCVEGSKLILTVKDSGKGFDPGQTFLGLGLVSMRERAAAVGGTLTTDSNKKGTTVSLRIPV